MPAQDGTSLAIHGKDVPAQAGDRCDTKHGVLIDGPTRSLVRNPFASCPRDPVRIVERQSDPRHAFTPQDPSDLGLEPLDRVGGVQRWRQEAPRVEASVSVKPSHRELHMWA